jgi:methionyl-tRNA synthetase
VLGKDIVRFHAIFWPAFLMAIELPMPKKLLVHGWINVNKQKMSKSLGNVVDPMVLLQSYGADAVRYYLLKQLAITHDSEFSVEDLERHIATDLANDLGNLLNRLVLLAQKYDCLVIQTPATWSQQALDVRDESLNVVQDVQAYMDDCMFHMALARIWQYIGQVNAYFHNNEPWKLVKQDKAHFVEVLAATRNALSVIATLLWPVMPVKMNELLTSIGEKHGQQPTLIADLVLKSWQEKQHALLVLPTLFTKPEPKTVIEQPKEDRVEPSIPYIGIEDLLKVHLVVGTITACSTVEKSDKLLKMQVDCGGYGERQILGGVRASFAPEDLIGRQALFVLNLPPRMMLGMESQGMMLIAKDEQGKTQLMSPIASVPNGTRLQ